MIILVDLDGPLADWEGYFLEKWISKFPKEEFIPFVRRETFKVKDQYPEHLREMVESIDKEKGFYLNLPPVAGGISAVKEMLDLGHDVRICTSPLIDYQNCVLEKYQWVHNNLGFDFVKRMILVRDKTFIKGDFLIDDNPKIHGVNSPGWEHVLFDCPYNQNIPGRRITSWRNWKDVLNV